MLIKSNKNNKNNRISIKRLTDKVIPKNTTKGIPEVRESIKWEPRNNNIEVIFININEILAFLFIFSLPNYRLFKILEIMFLFLVIYEPFTSFIEIGVVVKSELIFLLL